jgi:hypothetical protein
MPKTSTSGQVAVLTVATSGHAIAVDSQSIYFDRTDGIYRGPKTGGAAQRLSTNVTSVVDIVVTSNAVYWANGGSAGSIMKLAL